MAIILAIEPDRKQAAHLSAVVRHRVGAELILADTTEGALDAIGSRVPDLVLVPALLSPQDDAALAAALRVIAVAAHVRTLTTPVFSSGTKRSHGGGGLLSRFLGDKSDTTSSVGCDPAVFAEQISDYLREAAEERAELEADSDFNQPFAEEPVVAAPPVFEPAAPPAFEPAAPPVFEPAPAPVVRERELFASFSGKRTFEPEPEQAPETATASATETAPETPPAFAADPAPEVSPFAFVETANEIFARPERHAEPIVEEEESDDVIVIDLSDDIVEISPETMHADEPSTDSSGVFDGERFGIYTIPMSLDEPLDKQMADVVAAAKPDETKAQKVSKAPIVLKPIASKPLEAPPQPVVAVEPIVAEARVPKRQPGDGDRIWLGLRHTSRWPVLEGVAVESASLTEFAAPSIDQVGPMEDGAPPRAQIVTPQPAHRPEHRDWATLVASLRQDMERRRHQPGTGAAARPAPAPRPITNPAAPSALRKPRKAGPIQDEWGFFDPQQCGFAALLEKLDEFSDGPGDPTAPKAS